ncbi:uncharacterized protein BHQ10_004995 [Talaromyces amestolkiae]|uniref:L-ornithine N(5)-oxygenase n=1 Tax=Talaromyces amestolkiae TaxID=1196081 RepID=A0A364KZJ3_TALAM|nr:uncharacterized protein BHQ10_004995 [Talaromyces amestolkiae]RAO68983.1 hypothetical protein BHQ10_004995 [Talaromyces amestolkiae]
MNEYTRQKPIDNGRPVRVIIIGAGVSGIALYIRLLQYVPNVTITIFEKNAGLGGTWFENRYPGVACDIPSHVYQYSFEPNTRWSQLFASGPEILEYVKGVASKYRVAEKIKYNSKVVSATWNNKKGVWLVITMQNKSSGESEVRETEAEIVISAVGILNNWKWPEIEGLELFEGKLLHSANWDTTWDYEGKTVALLGCGSSAIQILPHLQRKCLRVHNFIRGGTWISQPFGSTFTENILTNSTEPGNYSYTNEELQRFESDTDYYQTFRREIESFINKDFPCLFPGTPEEIESTQKLKDNMRAKLASTDGVYEAIEPQFTPGCRRLTPGPGYLEALTRDNVELVKKPIARFTRRGVVTTDGTEFEVDAIVCATGFDCSYKPRFPVIGKRHQNLSEKWQRRASAYLSHSTPGFPNYFTVGGPNSATGGGSLLLILESVMGYVVKAVQKISRENIKSMEVKESALRSWQTHLDQYFPKTVHVDSCTSWYKIDGKIIGLWPGSSLHAMKTLEHPRWEDYEYELVEKEDELSWLGNGWTIEDVNRGNLGYYIDFADMPPIPSEELLARQP